MNEDIQQLISKVQQSADMQVNSINELQKAVDEGNNQELLMDGIDLLLDKERKGQSKKELDDVENEIRTTNDILNDIRSGLAAWSEAWNDLFSSLKDTAQQQLANSDQQLLLADQSRIADEEARREAARAADAQGPDGPQVEGGLDVTPIKENDTKGLFSIFSLIALTGAVAKLFDVDALMRIPATLTLLFTKVGVFAKAVTSVVEVVGRFSATLGKILGAVGAFLKPLGSLLGKLALPVTIIMGVLDAIGGFAKGFSEGGIVAGIREAIVGIFDGLIGTFLKLFGLDALNDMLKDGIRAVFDGIVAIPDTIGKMVTSVKEGFENSVIAVADFFNNLGEEFADLLAGAIAGVKEGFNSVVEGVSNFFNTMVDVVDSAIAGAIAGVSDKINMMIGSVGQVFDQIVTTVSDTVSSAVSFVTDKAMAVFDPIKNAFTNMVDMVKGVFDLSKIKMMLTNMFAEIGVPRVEFDVPVIGKVGFGPFYPFRPDADTTQVQASSSVATDGAGGKSITSSGSDITKDQVLSQARDLQREQRVNELGETEVVETLSTVGAAFDDATGRGTVTFETGKTIDNLVTDQFQELDNAIETFDVGPIAMGKVRRMIDAGATPDQVKEFLKENEVTIADKISQFLSPFTDKAKDLAGRATEAATDLAYDAEDAITGAGSAIGDAASTVGFGAMDQVDALSDFAGGAFKQAQAALISNPYANLDEETQDKIGALRSSLRMIRGEEDALGNITTDAQLEGTIEKGEGFLKAERDLEQQIADLSGMSLEDSRAAEKLVAQKNFLLGGELSTAGAEDFDFDDLSQLEPTPSRALAAPVGQASQEIAAEQSAANVVAPVTNANVNNSSQVNNVYNSKTVAPAPQARSSDPTFQRMQNANFGGV